MFETLEINSWHNFYMSTQNGPHLEISWKRNLIHPLELKLQGFKCFQGSHAIAMFTHKDYGCMGYVDNPLPNIVYMAILMATCIVWLNCMVVSGQSFFCLVCGPLEKNKEFNVIQV